MQSNEQHLINQVQHYRPPCPKCHGLMSLVLVEPAPEDGHDLRTFACDTCGQSEAIKVKFR